MIMLILKMVSLVLRMGALIGFIITSVIIMHYGYDPKLAYDSLSYLGLAILLGLD